LTRAALGAHGVHYVPARRAGALHRVGLTLIGLALTLALLGLDAPAAFAGGGHTGDAFPRAGSDAARVLRLALNHEGAGYRMGAEGHKYFDCSGFVYRMYEMAGLLGRIGSSRKGATAYFHWFRSRGLASRSDPRPGDLIAYGGGKPGRVPHIAIYIGNGRAISALNPRLGVREHGVHGIGLPVKAYLHVRIGR
jgi:cell wall-associated NlpC family hydrolase